MGLFGAGQLTSADHVVIVGYFLVMIVIGAYFYRLMRRMKDYFTGGASIPWWLSGASFYMSSFSVFGFVVNSSLAYKYGWVGITMFWAYVPGTLLCALVFAKRWRRARIDSPVEYLEARYNPAMRQLCAWHGIPVKIIDDALKLVATGVFLSVSLGLDLKQSMLWAGLIMLAYTFMGGVWAVVVTDFVQFVVMGAAVIILFVLAMVRTGGIGEFVHNAAPGSFDLVSAEYGWPYLASMVVLYAIAMSSVHWQLIQRFCCVPNEGEGRKLGFLVVALQLVTPVLMFLPGMAARQFLGPDHDPRQIYPLVCTTLLPAGLLGLMIAAMFAATMSMLSADYNACASVITNDVYRRLIRPRASDRELVLVGRLTTLGIGLVALGLAFYVVDQGEGGDRLFRSMVKLFSVATAPVAVPMILGLLSKRLSGVSAVVGLLGGLAVGLTFFFYLDDEVKVRGVFVKKENLLLFGTALTSAAVMFVASWLSPQSAAERARVAPFLERLASAVGAHDLDREDGADGSRAAVSPFRIVGISVAMIGVLMVAVAPFVEGALAFGLDLGLGLLMVGCGVWVARMMRPVVRASAPAAANLWAERAGEGA